MRSVVTFTSWKLSQILPSIHNRQEAEWAPEAMAMKSLHGISGTVVVKINIVVFGFIIQESNRSSELNPCSRSAEQPEK
jgi:hypothetical protein